MQRLSLQGYLYFDPRQLRGSGTTEVPRGRRPFEQAIVFMVSLPATLCCFQLANNFGSALPQVGGGNYTEYQNLQDHCQRHEERQIIYGVSQLVQAEKFLDQLTRLGTIMAGES